MFFAWFWWKLMFEVAVVTRKYMFWKKNFSKTQWASEQFCWFYSKKLKFWKNTVFWTILSFIEYQKDSNFVKTWIFADLEFQNLQNRPSLISGKNRGVLASFHMTPPLFSNLRSGGSIIHLGFDPVTFLMSAPQARKF